MRFIHLLTYLAWQAKEIVHGTLHELVMTFSPDRHQKPSIYAFQLRSCTDLEVTAVTAALAVTPGSQVLGIAPASGHPITIYVHALDQSRAEMEDEIRELEERLFKAMRPRRSS